MNRRYDRVLLDLDGTLIGLDVSEFIPAYFSRAAAFMADVMAPDEFTKRLKQATRAMLSDSNPTRTNRQVFERHFFGPISPKRRIIIEEKFDRFYRVCFPQLAYLCEPIPAAVMMIPKLLGLGCELILATNPVFPLVAIRHRLSWGRLSPSWFSHITSYENSAFCKPHLGYYQHLLGAGDVPASRTLMVGNDPLEDLIAAEVGMDTFLVEHYVLDRGSKGWSPTHQGTLEHVVEVVKGDGGEFR